MRELAPTIHRQRMVIEGHVEHSISESEIVGYLAKLSDVLGMTTLLEPVTHRSDTYGWAGWIHWETSGAHFYAWDEPRPFFSVDIYTCKEFDALAAARFTASYFEASDIEFDEYPRMSDHPFLRRSDVRGLTELLVCLEDRPDRHETPFGLYVIDGDSVFADLGRFTELNVFFEYFGNDAALMSAEYDPFDSASRHLVVVDHERLVPAGSTRVIHHSYMGFKSLIDMSQRPEWDISVSQIEQFHEITLSPESTLDQATIAVMPDYRGGGSVSSALFHALYWYSLRHNIQNVIGIGDVNFIEMCWALDTPCKVICDLPPLAYLDSPLSRPLTINVDEMRSAVRGADTPMAKILRGAGVVGAVSLPRILLSDASVSTEALTPTLTGIR